MPHKSVRYDTICKILRVTVYHDPSCRPRRVLWERECLRCQIVEKQLDVLH